MMERFKWPPQAQDGTAKLTQPAIGIRKRHRFPPEIISSAV